MPAFSPEFSKIFKIAAYSNLVSSTVFTLVRFAIILLLSFSLGYSLLNNNLQATYVLSALIILNLMFEAFYNLKVLDSKPTKTIKEVSSGGNIAESLDLQAAKIILNASDITKVSSLLKSLTKDSKVQSFFTKAGFSKSEVESLIKASAKDTIEIQKIVLKAAEFANKEEKKYIDQVDLLLALFTETAALKQAAFTNQIKEAGLLNIAFWVRHLFEKEGVRFWQKPVNSFGLGLASLWEGGWTLETEKYSKLINKEILSGKVKNHLVGRENIIQQIEEILSRSGKRNVILVGEAGVGKSTVVYGLAEKSSFGELPKTLKYKRFLEIDLTALLSSAGKGVLEERLNYLLTEVSHATDVVLFIPEIEYLTTSEGGGADVTGLLMGAFQSSNLQVIGTSTRVAFKKHIETNEAFSESFEIVDMPEPNREESIRILEEASTNIETEDKIKITYKAIETAVDLSKRYLVDRVLPGKAIDLLDEAAAALSLKKEKILKPKLVEQIISQKTKTPISLAKGTEAQKLLNLEDELHKRIIDQEEAIKSISESIRRARSLRRETTRPIGVFLFLGPTGVGKTETVKALSSVYFGSEERIIRVDMSEYQEENSLNRLIGSPPGSRDFGSGGQLTEKVRTNPFTTILLDELEKAHPKIQEVFLPVFDEGKMADSSGRQIIFTNTIIIATSNAGAEFIRESIQRSVPITQIKESLLEKLQRENIFKPEFLNRFDDTLVYKPLSPEDMREIAKLLTSKLTQNLKKQDIDIHLDEAALGWIAEKGYNPTYGARPLRRLIQNEVEGVLAKKILSGELPRGSKVSISASGGTLSFTPASQ
jgi:ATP-dependent Clp protease ATP-binding subunit ClpC